MLSPRSVVIFRVVLFFRTSLIFEQVLFSNKSYFRTSLIFEQVLFLNKSYFRTSLIFEQVLFSNKSYFLWKCLIFATCARKLLCVYVYQLDFSKQVLFFAQSIFVPSGAPYSFPGQFSLLRLLFATYSPLLSFFFKLSTCLAFARFLFA